MNINMYKLIVPMLIVSLCLVSCNNEKEAPQISIEEYFETKNITNAVQTASGLYYVINEVGTGVKPQLGESVSVHYTGYHLDGTKFDSSFDRNAPFTFNLGAGQVIAGWDEGIALLEVGGSGTLYIPSKLAYGSRGQGSIAPNENLKFDVELVGIN